MTALASPPQISSGFKVALGASFVIGEALFPVSIAFAILSMMKRVRWRTTGIIALVSVIGISCPSVIGFIAAFLGGGSSTW